jgi:hypothetical protein
VVVGTCGTFVPLRVVNWLTCTLESDAIFVITGLVAFIYGSLLRITGLVAFILLTRADHIESSARIVLG